ncbi:MAG: M23 family metallopeptidase [Azoarcus sp.]|nr:M23 family metallopeptidase [Azoarcus sp.]
MAGLSWPLEINRIRGAITNNAYGMVRNGGAKPHQGWDLEAAPGTPCYAIADGKIVWANDLGNFGLTVILEFQHRGRTLYASYAHLMSHYVYREKQVTRGDMLGRTGQSGNATGQPRREAHLHFGIHTIERPLKWPTGWVDPAQLYGVTPINSVFIERFDQSLKVRGAAGLLVPGVNVRERE